MSQNQLTPQYPAKDLAAPLSQPAPTSAFYPHGIWAPGVKLMRNMHFRTKALLIVAIFLIPIAMLASAFYTSENEAIAFSEKESGQSGARRTHVFVRWHPRRVGTLYLVVGTGQSMG